MNQIERTATQKARTLNYKDGLATKLGTPVHQTAKRLYERKLAIYALNMRKK